MSYTRFTPDAQSPGTADHPIPPSAPRGGYLAKVVMSTGLSRIKHFRTRDGARAWVSEQWAQGGVKDAQVTNV